jgi:hypothetical protein
LPWGLNRQQIIFTVFPDLIELYEFLVPERAANGSPAPAVTEEVSDGIA